MDQEKAKLRREFDESLESIKSETQASNRNLDQKISNVIQH